MKLEGSMGVGMGLVLSFCPWTRAGRAVGGSSRVSCPVLGAGRKAGRAGQGAVQGKWLQLTYLLFLLREENRGPVTQNHGGEGPPGGSSARRGHDSCWEWMHLGAGLRPWAPKVLTEPVTPAQESPVPSGLAPGEEATCTCLNPGSVAWAQDHPPRWGAGGG